ncbi:hypothetical protein ETD83_04250 [Actinomadura soli]|uniref:Transcriptional repressor PaaX-like central Cas2-like domain-containing protein n=1 Tax=Actinomadura soli TaxID=2508997 RepID=A0A5C4JIA9_9ACTN|nr:hypothetical protein [Actinomadura soli]TMR06550.1 hypothetical protein ETD83_04250 [Actinomadura soli]
MAPGGVRDPGVGAARPGRTPRDDRPSRRRPVQSGLYISPNAWENLIEPEVARLGVQEHATLLTSRDLRVGPERNARALA